MYDKLVSKEDVFVYEKFGHKKVLISKVDILKT